MLAAVLASTLLARVTAQAYADCYRDSVKVNTPYCPHLPGKLESPVAGAEYEQNATITISWNSDWPIFAARAVVDVYVCSLANANFCWPIQSNLRAQFESAGGPLNVGPGEWFAVVVPHGDAPTVVPGGRSPSFIVKAVTPTLTTTASAGEKSTTLALLPTTISTDATSLPNAGITTQHDSTTSQFPSTLHIILIASGSAALLLLVIGLFLFRRRQQRNHQYRVMMSAANKAGRTGSMAVIMDDKPESDSSALEYHEPHPLQTQQSQPNTISNSEAIIIANSFKIALKKPIGDDDDDEDISTMISNMGIKPMSPDRNNHAYISDSSLTQAPSSSFLASESLREDMLDRSDLNYHARSNSVNSDSIDSIDTRSMENRSTPSPALLRPLLTHSTSRFNSTINDLTRPKPTHPLSTTTLPHSSVSSSHSDTSNRSLSVNSRELDDHFAAPLQNTSPHWSIASGISRTYNERTASYSKDMTSMKSPSSTSHNITPNTPMSLVEQVNMDDLASSKSASMFDKLRSLTPTPYVVVVDENENYNSSNNHNTSIKYVNNMIGSPATSVTSSDPLQLHNNRHNVGFSPNPSPASIADDHLTNVDITDNESIILRFITNKVKFSEAARRKSSVGSIRSAISTYDSDAKLHSSISNSNTRSKPPAPFVSNIPL